MGQPSFEEIADGMALWDEHKPQSGEDWIAVAERFIADGCTTEKSSPLFAAVVLAVTQRDQLRQQVERLLSATTYAAKRLQAADTETNFGDDFEAEVRAVSEELTAAADQVRKELGQG